MSGHAASVTKADRVCGPVSSHGTPRDQGAAARRLASTARVESGPETVEEGASREPGLARVRRTTRGVTRDRAGPGLRTGLKSPPNNMTESSRPVRRP